MMVFPLAFICIFTLLLSLFTKLSMAIDTLSPNETLTDNGKLVSSGEAFELGFFNPPYSNNRYIGIWFKNVPIQTPIWVANKNNPISDSSGLLTITTTGNIIITTTTTTNQTTTVWSSSNSSPPTPPNKPILQLLDSGNLVVKNGGGDYLWQSFDYPCDTLVAGMKFGWNLRTNQEWFLTSWKTLQDPSSGDYTYKLDRRGLPQIVLHQGSTVTYRSGSWDGVRFGGDPPLHTKAVIDPIFIFNSTDVYYSFKNTDDTAISRIVVNQTGSLQLLTWHERLGEWFNLFTMQRDACDVYGTCGPYGICRFDVLATCYGPNGFIPRSQQEWDRGDWSGGCVRRTPMNCSAPQGFRKLSRLKLPDSSYFLVDMTKMSLVDCKEACLRNCTCVAFALTSVSGCVVWFGELFDMKEFSEHGQDLYIRMAASDLGSNKKNQQIAVITSIIVISGVLVLSLIGWYFLRELHMRRARRLDKRNQKVQDNNRRIVEEEDLALLLFDLATVSSATNNFSLTNKIGEGGFGLVYRVIFHNGELTTGREIAVKRLSKTSGQGLTEFKNEVILISKLQHRNLVRLLGCCIHEEERMLIYEYMPNKSLDTFIFNQTRGTSLDWKKRFDIIVGIARGLLYLHRDSRLRVIHRDLKAGNILLDSEMNPKIADFGLARSFGGDHFEENTNRVIGTYGYMSPEYAINGHFSVKSDVFSFGVMVLEIVSGKKNRGFYDPDHDLNLLGHAWKLWNEGKPIKLFDVFMEDAVPTSEVFRCIQVALLCVQQHPEDRPTMSSVLLMLDSENPVLPMPKQPGFYSERVITNIDYSSTGKHHCTTNEVTITMLQGR
ncbi:G-type lectin S-receptor-like serine/threonine-protein kinase At4g27290 isoform X2 [Camellia sinensis]|uniref:G-type lectin S-receptor-like serine/threonine-protein kinase At4g27290 isoform X2 n=1 Tax=Camellia sinensis TaxID=4442 RepID=UPI00103681AF|nr:G-type lectin S-receptor-like serine/threonine-protein kinase At4g27290 isoform X2 [Camellia sinensis]